ncbi:protein translocase subunit SecF [bacterium]|nr:protein translocase subunit SecF [bacterium]
MQRRFSFLRARTPMIALSALVLALAVAGLVRNSATIGAPLNLGIEFTGGVLFDLDMGGDPDVEAVRAVLEPILAKAPQIQVVEEAGRPILSLRTEALEDPDVVLDALEEAFGIDPQEDLLRKEEIGGQFSQELAGRAVLATIVGVILILLYIAFRFSFAFGVGAVVALIHDLLVVLGAFALWRIEVGIPFVAAVLTILGYSINDTIVVYDRIRENLRASAEDDPFEEIVETSLWQTLSRTINTTATTLLALVAVHIFGGPTLRPFTLALIIGFLAGTYSSIFVASPFVIWWERRRAARRLAFAAPAPDIPAVTEVAPMPEVAPTPEAPSDAPPRDRRRGRRRPRRRR